MEVFLRSFALYYRVGLTQPPVQWVSNMYIGQGVAPSLYLARCFRELNLCKGQAQQLQASLILTL